MAEKLNPNFQINSFNADIEIMLDSTHFEIQTILEAAFLKISCFASKGELRTDEYSAFGVVGWRAE